jgi:fatty-acid desaturase
MRSLIDDIINDPSMYLPTLLYLAVVLLFWGGLCLSGFASLRAATRRRRFWFALAPLIFGLIGVLAQMSFSMEGDGYRLGFDLRWLFVVPLLLGIAGVVSSWRVRHESVA